MRNVATLTMDDYGYLWATLPNKASQLAGVKEDLPLQSVPHDDINHFIRCSLMEILSRLQ